MNPIPQNRELDLEGLKALAHPLRVRIIDTLSVYGSFTASGLAERLGESSGATSYHLRQLEKHGFVREVEGKGTGRERWWERVPGAINMQPRELKETPSGRAAARMVLQQWQQSKDELLNDFLARADEVLSDEWMESSVTITANARLTSEQLHEYVLASQQLLNATVDKYRGQNTPGSRPVQIHFNAFPVLDGEETPVEHRAQNEEAQ